MYIKSSAGVVTHGRQFSSLFFGTAFPTIPSGESESERLEIVTFQPLGLHTASPVPAAPDKVDRGRPMGKRWLAPCVRGQKAQWVSVQDRSAGPGKARCYPQPPPRANGNGGTSSKATATGQPQTVHGNGGTQSQPCPAAAQAPVTMWGSARAAMPVPRAF